MSEMRPEPSRLETMDSGEETPRQVTLSQTLAGTPSYDRSKTPNLSPQLKLMQSIQRELKRDYQGNTDQLRGFSRARPVESRVRPSVPQTSAGYAAAKPPRLEQNNRAVTPGTINEIARMVRESVQQEMRESLKTAMRQEISHSVKQELAAKEAAREAGREVLKKEVKDEIMQSVKRELSSSLETERQGNPEEKSAHTAIESRNHSKETPANRVSLFEPGEDVHESDQLDVGHFVSLKAGRVPSSSNQEREINLHRSSSSPRPVEKLHLQPVPWNEAAPPAHQKPTVNTWMSDEAASDLPAPKREKARRAHFDSAEAVNTMGTGKPEGRFADDGILKRQRSSPREEKPLRSDDSLSAHGTVRAGSEGSKARRVRLVCDDDREDGQEDSHFRSVDRSSAGAPSIRYAGAAMLDYLSTQMLEDEEDSSPSKRGKVTLEDSVEFSITILCGGFHISSKVRRWCFNARQQPVWSALFLLSALMSGIYAAVVPTFEQGFNTKEPEAIGTDWSALDWIDFFCTFVLLVEVCMGSVALGFVGSPSTWLRVSGFHQLDFLVLCVSFWEYGSAFFSYTTYDLRPFRLLRILMPLTQVRELRGVAAILEAMQESWTPLVNLLYVFLFFMVAFCAFGMATLGRTFRRHCVTLPRVVPACTGSFATHWGRPAACDLGNFSTSSVVLASAEPVVSGGFPFGRSCKIIADVSDDYSSYPIDPDSGLHHTCQLNEFRAGEEVTAFCAEVGNPNFGFTSFDNFFSAFLVVLQCATEDNQYEVLHRALEGEEPLASMVWVYFIAITCMLTFLFMGLFVAVVTDTFGRVRERHGTAFLSSEEYQRRNTEWGVGKRDPAANAQSNKIAPEDERNDGDGSDQVSFRDVARRVKSNPLFGTAISVVIMANCFYLALLDANASQDLLDSMHYMLPAFTFCFSFEVLVHFGASGSVSTFVTTGSNVMDSVVLLFMVIGLATGEPVLQFLSSLHIFRLMRYFPTLQDLLTSALASSRSIINLILFISIVGFTCAITGMYIFRDRLVSAGRADFSTVNNAFLTCFMIMTGDQWTTIMYAGMDSMDSVYGQALAVIYFICWYIFSKLIVSNLFIAVIIENFEVSRTLEAMQQEGNLSKLRAGFAAGWEKVRTSSSALFLRNVAFNDNTDSVHRRRHDRRRSSAVLMSTRTMQDLYSASEATALMKVAQRAGSKRTMDKTQVEEENDIACGVLARGNPVRRIADWLCGSSVFEAMVLFAILGSIFNLTMQPAAEDDPLFNWWLSQSTIDSMTTVFTVIFTIEFVVRVLANGFWQSRAAYLKNGWNRMDFIVLILSWADQLQFVSGSFAQVLRLSRALRPLRLIKRNQGMRIIIDALLSTMGPVLYASIFSVATSTVFSIVGMALFGGKMFRCSEAGAEFPGGKTECAGFDVRPDGIMAPRAWVNPPYNFDKFTTASMSLFRVATLRFTHILTSVMDLTERDVSPDEGASARYANFIVVYVFVGSFFVMNMFVGFIIDGYEANQGVSKIANVFNRFIKTMQEHSPRYPIWPLPQGRFRAGVRWMTKHRFYQQFSAWCMVANCLFMLADHTDPSPTFQQVMEIQNLVFFAEMAMEVVLFTIGHGIQGYIDDKWEIFDVVICFGASFGFSYWSNLLSGVLSGQTTISNSQKIAQVGRAFRLLRVVRLMQFFKPLQRILDTLYRSIPQLLNILLLLFTIYSMFAVIAVNAFGTVKYGRRLGPTANFNKFTDSMKTIYQMVIGDEWDVIMDDCSVVPPYCTRRFNSDFDEYFQGQAYSFGDCGFEWSSAFFVPFKIVCEAVMLNLFIGMILDNFSFVIDEDDRLSDTLTEHIDSIVAAFKNHDRKTATFPTNALFSFLTEIDAPLGYRLEGGDVEFRDGDRVFQKLVRAELNLIMRENNHSLADIITHSTGYRMLVSALGAVKGAVVYVLCPARVKAWRNWHRTKLYANSVNFQEVVMAVLFWRRFDIVPDGIKSARHLRLEETVLMAHQLVLCNFFNRAVGLRKQQQIVAFRALHGRWDRWAQVDEVHQRRERAMRGEEQSEARPSGVDSAGESPSVTLEPIQRIPDNAMSACDFPEASASAEDALRRFAANSERYVLVVRFVDDAQRGGERHDVDTPALHALDLTKCMLNADGYASRTHDKDCFLERVVDGPPPVQFVRPSTAKEKHLQPRHPRLRVGFLHDVQVYEGADGQGTAGGLEASRFSVRINLGPQDEGEEAPGFPGIPWCQNGVLEVLGCLPMFTSAAAAAPARKTNKVVASVKRMMLASSLWRASPNNSTNSTNDRHWWRPGRSEGNRSPTPKGSPAPKSSRGGSPAPSGSPVRSSKGSPMRAARGLAIEHSPVRGVSAEGPPSRERRTLPDSGLEELEAATAVK